MPPFINFAPLQNAADALAKSGEHYNKALNAALKGSPDAAKLAALNDKLLTAERLLLNPGRPADPSVLQAHALRAGTLHRLPPKDVSGIRESIELKDYKLADSEVPRVAKAVNDEAAFVEQMATELDQIAGQ